MDKQDEERFYSPGGLPPLQGTKWEICVGYARSSIRINQANQTISNMLCRHDVRVTPMKAK
jgi:hypothetical protein